MCIIISVIGMNVIVMSVTVINIVTIGVTVGVIADAPSASKRAAPVRGRGARG